MTWQPELDELRRRERLAEQLGGADKVERQHHFGKLTVRERVEQVADDGSFWELGKTAGVARYDEHGNLIEFTPSNFVFGIAELDGRPVVLSGDDFTVRGGSNDASISAKREASEAIAAEMRLPHVRLLDGMSGGGSVKTIEQAGRTYIPVLPGWHVVVDHLNIAPSVSLVLGSVAGFGAARAVASHYSVMVRDTSQMMHAGCNDLGGTLMDENISRAAGASHGQEMTVQGFREFAESIGRPLEQRTTGYGRIEPTEQPA